MTGALRLAADEFYGDTANGRVFINQTIPNPTPLPLNVRATYALSGNFFRDTGTTENFTRPPDFFTQSLTAELRFGGIEPGLTAKRGAELYLSADANCRTGFAAFGPDTGFFPAHNEYDRLFGSLGGKIPAGPTTVAVRLSGGLGEHLDELSAWKLGGNLVNLDPFAYTIHGYYTREIFADDFGLANLTWSVPLTDAGRPRRPSVRRLRHRPHARCHHRRRDGWHNIFGVGPA